MANAHSIPYRRIYVWELPVRLYHWVNALCVFLLIVTGYLIGNPVGITYQDGAQTNFSSWQNQPRRCAATRTRDP